MDKTKLIKTKIYGSNQTEHYVDLPESILVRLQVKTFEKIKFVDEVETKLVVKLRYDDQCGNSKNSFAITADIYEKNKHDRWVDVGGGCCHDEIVNFFPEFEPLVKWHLFDSSGPMHYISNSLYHASDRDCWGKLKGEPKAFEKVLKFEGFPIRQKLKQKFITWLEEQQANGSKWDFEIMPVKHINRSGADYNFADNWTLLPYGSGDYYSCPFDSEQDAKEFLDALQKFTFTVESIPTLFGEGKEPDLDAARSCAVWPDAELKDFTENNLLERLPALANEFKLAMESLGFVY